MEQPVSFNVEGCVLHGILGTPDAGVTRQPSGILFLNGWAGYRIGPHRIFVRAARLLAAVGFASMRFDFRGRGESEGAAGDTTISTMIADAAAGVATLCAAAGLERVILLGICSGSKVALGAVPRDSRIAHLILWSADPLDARFAAAMQRRKKIQMLKQYGGKFFQAATWRKLIRGRLNPRLIARAVSGAERPANVSENEAERDRRILDNFRAFKGEVYFLYGGHDPLTAPAQAGFEEFCRTHHIEHRIDVIPDADHNFTSLDWERQAFDKTLAWLETRVKAKFFLPGQEKCHPEAGWKTETEVFVRTLCWL